MSDAAVITVSAWNVLYPNGEDDIMVAVGYPQPSVWDPRSGGAPLACPAGDAEEEIEALFYASECDPLDERVKGFVCRVRDALARSGVRAVIDDTLCRGEPAVGGVS